MAGYKRHLRAFKEFYLDQGVEEALAERYSIYAARLASKGLPVIFEIEHLSICLKKTRNYLASVINAPEKHYRSFEIPKKKGGRRKILAPYPALLDCQKWILENILSKIAIEKCAHAYVPGKSIISNAEIHRGARAILKLDVKDFFPSIKISWVIRTFIDAGYAPNVAFYLASICCDGKALPQGAATSPCLSNIVCKGMDRRLSILANKWGLKYSRYADDLCFSGDYVAGRFLSIVHEVLGTEGFELNEAKTRLMLGVNRKTVTGINVAGLELRLPSSYKRELKKLFYFIKNYGLESHLSKLKVRDPYYLDRIIGRVSYWVMVESWNDEAKNILRFFKGLKVAR